MSHHTFQITSYTINLGHSETNSFIYCYRDDGREVHVVFFATGTTAPRAQISADRRIFTIFVPLEHMGLWTDMLRNEKPLYAHVDPLSPQMTKVSTNLELVGEEESS